MNNIELMAITWIKSKKRCRQALDISRIFFIEAISVKILHRFWVFGLLGYQPSVTAEWSMR